MKKIFITVTGGVAEVCADTVPEGFEVEIIDFDNIEEGGDYPSKEAVEYAISKGWDTDSDPLLPVDDNDHAHPAKERLEYLRGELRAERISYGELVELQSLAPYIASDDVELLEAAGIEENQ